MKSLFENYKDNNNWINKLDLEKLYCEFKENGYSIVEKFIPEVELLKIYQDSVSKMHSGEIDVDNWRHDLGSHQKPAYKNVEKRTGYKESDLLGGIDPYGASKSAADIAISSYIKSFFYHINSSFFLI